MTRIRSRKSSTHCRARGRTRGRPAVFCRFAGCNLWSGSEEHRPAASCRFCDTDFVGTDGPGGGRFETAARLAAAVASAWPETPPTPGLALVVCTGGEPLLQLDEEAVAAFHAADFEVAVETNGTLPPPAGIDWLTVSPKARADLLLRAGDELKLVYPQGGAEPRRFRGPRLPPFLPAADGRPRPRPECPGRRPLLPGEPPMAAHACRSTRSSACPSLRPGAGRGRAGRRSNGPGRAPGGH
jgi:7-carboxy-7-deazaguanine synthase (Cx14CxxC type)